MALSGVINGSIDSITDGKYLQLTWSADQSIANNSSMIYWNLDMVASDPAHQGWIATRNIKVVIDGRTVYTRPDRYEQWPGGIASGVIEIYHNNDGNRSFSASIEGGLYYSHINSSGSGSWSLDTIPRVSGISCTTAKIGEKPTFTISKRVSSFTHTLTYLFGSLRGTIVERTTASSYNGWTIPDSFYTMIPDMAVGIGTIYCTTYSGNSEIGTSSCGFSVEIDKAKNMPTMNPTAEDTNSVSLALTGDKNKIVRYISNLKVVSNAVGKNSATIKSQKITCGSKSISAGNATLAAVDSDKIVFTATDTRGLTATQTLTKTMIPYVKPTCILNVENPTASGKVDINISGNVFNGSFGTKSNTISVEYRYYEEGGSYGAWQKVTPSYYNSTYSADIYLEGLNYTKAYTFQARLSDAIQTVTTPAKTVKTVPIFDWGKRDFAFNVPVSIEGNNVVDFIVELDTESMGTNGTWKIEKWASGKAVCYGLWNAGNMGVSTAWGSGYQSANALDRDFPTGLFIATPDIINIDIQSSNGSAFVGRGANAPSATNTGSFWVWRPTSATLSQVKFSIYAVGRWK